MERRNNDNRNRVKVPKQAKEFAELTFKKYKKKEASGYETKKELKENYFLYLLELLPEAINFVVKYGYIQTAEVQEAKAGIYEKFVSDDYLGFVKILKKQIKNGEKIENVKILPIALREILSEADKQNKILLSQDPNAKLYQMDNIVELSKLILKKRLKKMIKRDVDPAIAFDVLSIIPTDKCLEKSQNYRIHVFYESLYEHAKTKKIPFEAVMKEIVSSEYHLMFIAFALLERKEKFTSLTDPQREFYSLVTEWCFKTLEESPKDDIFNVLKVYVNGRKRDDARGKDSNRRYYISSLPPEDYPRINKVIAKMKADDSSIEKYL